MRGAAAEAVVQAFPDAVEAIGRSEAQVRQKKILLVYQIQLSQPQILPG